MDISQYRLLPDWPDFLKAYKTSIGHEGGYANDPKDNGGETYCGVARKFWPNWAGWQIIDKNKPLKKGQLIADETLNMILLAFYYDNFWIKVGASRIEDKEYAKKQFDRAINLGVSEAIKEAELAINMPVTGKLSDVLIEALNHPDKHLL